MALDHPNAAGLISQSRLDDSDPNLVQMTPGVRFGVSGDKLGQQYVGPEQAVLDKGADVIIVGRGITGDANPGAKAEEYKTAGWQAYLKRTS